MQFKMAENSLFAILLRAPFWYSLLLALFIVMIAGVAFGSKAIVFGIAAGLPFFGISAMAGWRQWQQPGARQIEQTIELVTGLSAREFKQKVSDAYERQGYEVEPYKGKAADLKLTKGWREILVCSSRFKAARQGIEPLRSLKQVGKESEATGLTYIALGEFTENASKYAADNNIELLDATGLTELFFGKGRHS